MRPANPHSLRSLPSSRTLPDRAADDLREAIRGGLFGPQGRLPSEPTLATQLAVSRATLRHAISILEEEGLVTRRQGSGTFVVEPVNRLRNNLNANFGVTDLVEAAGWQPGTRNLAVREHVADRAMTQGLGLPPRSKVVSVERVRTADERAVAYTLDHLSSAMLREHNLDVDLFESGLSSEQSVYRLLELHGVTVHHGIATVRPAVATETQRQLLGLPSGALLLLLDQVDYTADGEAVLLSEEYHVADLLAVQVYRKGPGSRA